MGFYREQKHICGKDYETAEYMEVDLYEVTAAQHNTSLREKKKEATSLAQQAYNDKRAKRYHVQLVNTNFKQGDYSWTGTYDDDHLPGADAKEQADRDWANFMKRVYRWCDKNGVERPKWVMATEYSTRGDDGKVTGRHHHHAIIQRTKGLDRDILEELWCDRKGEPLGLCRCEYLTMEHGSAASLVQYISKNKRCDRHWRQSRGLEKPKTPKPNDTKWSKRKLHEASTVHIDDAEYWERLYPGFKFDRAETNISDFGQRHTLVIMYRDSGFKRKQRYRERSRNGDDNLHCGQDRGRCEVS